MESLRVRKTLDIEVNDNGDIITIPVEDVQFLDGFYDLVDKFSNKGQEIKAKGTGMNQKEHIQLLVTVMQDITAEIDNIFGEDCCEKVFDTTAPSPYAVADFFDQMPPIFDRYTNERQKRIANKYSRERQGGTFNPQYGSNRKNRRKR